MAHYHDCTPGTHDLADKAATFHAYAAFKPKSDVVQWQYNPPKLGEDFIEIAITHSGICGSDIHTIDSGWGPTTYPCVVGHEIVGTVTAVGTHVSDLKVGDRVGVGAQVDACMDKKHDCPECRSGNENHCRNNMIWTYNSTYPDGQHAFGGYADRVRVPHRFAFLLPASIPSNKAPPLMCAGATVFSPLHRHKAGPGKKVGVVGVGGLGHMGLKYAVAMGADVTAISHSASKQADTKKWGVQHFLCTHDDAAMKAQARSFDLILGTADLSGPALEAVLALIKFDGTYCFVGIPEHPFSIQPFSLIMNRPNFVASLIGSRHEITEMLHFSAQHQIFPDIQEYPMTHVNDAIKVVRDGSIRYRAVLVNDKK